MESTQDYSYFVESVSYAIRLIIINNSTATISTIDGVTLSGQQAGLHFLLTLPRFPESELVNRAAAQGIRVHPLSRYCHSVPPLPSTVVVGFAGLSEPELEQAAKLLKTAYETP